MIERIVVEEGFLAGLDLEFSDGLNVLVGARGAGKTSIIELIRFCLGLGAYTEGMRRIGYQHATSVLGSGQVSVSLKVGETRVTVQRTAAEDQPRGLVVVPPVTVLGQGEIEHIGLEAQGRLQLIDLFRKVSSAAAADENRVLAQLRSLTAEISGLLGEVAELQRQIDGASTIPEQLEAAVREETVVLHAVDATKEDRERLASLQGAASELARRGELLDRARTNVRDWLADVRALAASRPLGSDWFSGDKPTTGVGVIQLVDAAAAQLGEAAGSIQEALLSLEMDIAKNQEAKVQLDEGARRLRGRLEQLQQGAGLVSRRVTELRERAGQLSALRAVADERRDRIKVASANRAVLFDQLDERRSARSADRRAIGKRLTDELAPKIRVRVEAAGNVEEYAAAIASSLRGGGIHYRSLAQHIAELIGPRELTELVERGDVESLARHAGLSPDRAARVIELLGREGTENLISAAVDDGVELSLLDGGEYKPSGELSTGQRCTVVLPILLAAHGGTLIVDQPEDNLDNAFVAETVVLALSQRLPGDQMIFATHNANIPVLAEADRVIVLSSNGKQASCADPRPLTHKASVHAISTLMEGGREAFQKRADFYQRRAE
jgi:ABC-type sugar transport system ATPase subunit